MKDDKKCQCKMWNEEMWEEFKKRIGAEGEALFESYGSFEFKNPDEYFNALNEAVQRYMEQIKEAEDE